MRPAYQVGRLLGSTFPVITGIALASSLGLLFFVFRVSRYDLALALGMTEFIQQLKFVADPGYLDGGFLRDSVMPMIPPVAAAAAHLAAWWGISPFTIEYGRLLALNVLSSVAVWILAWALFRDVLTSALAVLLIVGGGVGTVGLAWHWTMGTSGEWHYFALAVGLLVVASVYAGRYGTASALAGTLLSIHPSHALIAFALIVATYFRERGRPPIRDAIQCAALFGLLAAPAAIYLMPTLLASGSVAPGPLWWSLMRERKTHHLFPLSWGWRLWISTALIIGAGLLARQAVRGADGDAVLPPSRERTTSTILFTLVVICFTGTLFADVLPVAFVTRLGLLRASNYFEIILLLYVCRVARGWLSAPRVLVAALGIVLCAAIFWNDIAGRPARAVILIASLIAFFRPRLMVSVGDPSVRRVVACTGLLIAIAVPHLYMQALPSLPAGSGPPLRLVRAWKDTQLWARAHTPPGTVFVTSPNWCGFGSFSDRPVIITACDVGRSVYTPSLLAEELRRIRAYGDSFDRSGVMPVEFSRGWEGRGRPVTPTELRGIAEKFRGRYAVVPRPTNLPLPHAYENEGFVVYRMDDHAS